MDNTRNMNSANVFNFMLSYVPIECPNRIADPRQLTAIPFTNVLDFKFLEKDKYTKNQ